MSRISSTVLCQTNGLGWSLQLSTHTVMADSSSLVDRWVPRRSHLLVSSADLELDEVEPRAVGRSEWRWNRECRMSHPWISGVLWVSGRHLQREVQDPPTTPQLLRQPLEVDCLRPSQTPSQPSYRLSPPTPTTSVGKVRPSSESPSFPTHTAWAMVLTDHTKSSCEPNLVSRTGLG